MLKTKIPMQYLALITVLVLGVFVINESKFVFSTTYYASLPNLCGYNTTTTAGCTTGTVNTYCNVHYYKTTLACGTTSGSCVAETSSDSCDICGDCAGGSDTCNIASCGTNYKCASPSICNGQGKGAGYCVSLSGYGGTCYCDAQCSSPNSCNMTTHTCGIKDINTTLSSGIYKVIYGAPTLATSQCVNATNQTASYGVFNVTNNGTMGTEAVQVKILAVHENVDIVCSSSSGCTGTTLTTSYQTIIASLAQGSQAYIWCWANYNTPTTAGTTTSTYLQPA